MNEHTIALIALAVMQVSQVVLQILARADAARNAASSATAATKAVRINRRDARRVKAETTAKADEVKAALAISTQGMDGKLDSVHNLVNGQKAEMTAQLKQQDTLLRQQGEEIVYLKQQLAALIEGSKPKVDQVASGPPPGAVGLPIYHP